jgi:hypothetical protein
VTRPPGSESHGPAPGAGICTFMAQMAKGLPPFQTYYDEKFQRPRPDDMLPSR